MSWASRYLKGKKRKKRGGNLYAKDPSLRAPEYKRKTGRKYVNSDWKPGSSSLERRLLGLAFILLFDPVFSNNYALLS